MASDGQCRECVLVRTESDVSAAMRLGRDMAQRHGFSRVNAMYIATAVTELASNLWIHAGGGMLTVEWQPQLPGIEVRTQDSGPGIPDVALAMTDGYSTAGGLGCGLPGVGRLMDGLEIDSQPGHMTVVRAWKVGGHA